jgi:hypothetical protein
MPQGALLIGPGCAVQSTKHFSHISTTEHPTVSQSFVWLSHCFFSHPCPFFFTKDLTFFTPLFSPTTFHKICTMQFSLVAFLAIALTVVSAAPAKKAPAKKETCDLKSQFSTFGFNELH